MPAMAGRSGAVVLSFGVLGFLVAVGGLLAGRVALIALSGVAFLAQAVFALEPGLASAWWMIGYGAALFVFLDIGSGVVERRDRLPGAFGPQIWRSAMLALGAAGISAMVLLLARSPIERGILVQAAGVGAAATLVLAVARVARDRVEE